jgi:hypothetical protein
VVCKIRIAMLSLTAIGHFPVVLALSLVAAISLLIYALIGKFNAGFSLVGYIGKKGWKPHSLDMLLLTLQ